MLWIAKYFFKCFVLPFVSAILRAIERKAQEKPKGTILTELQLVILLGFSLQSCSPLFVTSTVWLGNYSSFFMFSLHLDVLICLLCG